MKEIQKEGVENFAFDGNVNSSQDLKSRTYEVSSMEELLDAAGTNGWRNYLIYFFSLWVVFISPFLVLSYQFLGAIPDYWCRVPELEKANWTEGQIKNYSIPSMGEPLESCEMLNLNYSEAGKLDYEAAMEDLDSFTINNETVECQKRAFDSNAPETVVTMWDLVCERRALYSTTQSALQAGKLVGAVLMGHFINAFGRKKMICILVPLYLVIGLVTVLSPNVEIYIVLKFIISIVQMGLPLAGLILALELCATSQRSLIGAMFNMPLAIGFMMLPGIAYLIRPFTYLHIALTLPALTLFPCFWVLPESPRWLVLKGRHTEAISVLQSLAMSNRRTLPSEEAMRKFMKRIHSEAEKGKVRRSALFSYFAKVNELLLDPSWFWKLLIIFFGWTTGAMVYYGMTFNSPNLSTDKYLYTFLISLLEVPSCFFIWLSTKYLGRKKSMVMLYTIGALSVLGVAWLSFSGTQEGGKRGWLIFLSLLGTFSSKSAYLIIWFYTPELIPTEQRSEILGLANLFARIGSISSPYIVDLLGEYANWVPSAIFGGFALVAGFLIIFLPETKNSQLAEHK